MFFHYIIEGYIIHKEVEGWGEEGSHLSHLLKNMKLGINHKSVERLLIGPSSPSG